MLGVAPGSDLAAVKAAWYRFAHTHHPDRGGDASHFMRGSEAYTVLMRSSALDRLLDSVSVGGFIEAVRGRRWIVAGLHVLGVGFVLFRDQDEEPR